MFVVIILRSIEIYKDVIESGNCGFEVGVGEFEYCFVDCELII